MQPLVLLENLMADYLQTRKLDKVRVDDQGWTIVETVDRVRQSQPRWGALLVETVQLKTRNGELVVAALDDAAVWIDQHRSDRLTEIFVRWTEDGRAARPSSRRIALRLDRESTLWVGDSDDEPAVVGMTRILEDEIRHARRPPGGGVSTRSGPPLDLPRPTIPAIPEAPSLEQSTREPTAVMKGTQARSGRLKGVLNHPLMIAVCATLIGGLLLALIIGTWRPWHTHRQAGFQSETVGGVTQTWSDYTTGGGSRGPTIGANVTVHVACRVSGMTVQDGDSWWYRISSPGWDNQYYASADAFYNNGESRGPLKQTPLVDPAVRNC